MQHLRQNSKKNRRNCLVFLFLSLVSGLFGQDRSPEARMLEKSLDVVRSLQAVRYQGYSQEKKMDQTDTLHFEGRVCLLRQTDAPFPFLADVLSDKERLLYNGKSICKFILKDSIVNVIDPTRYGMSGLLEAETASLIFPYFSPIAYDELIHNPAILKKEMIRKVNWHGRTLTRINLYYVLPGDTNQAYVSLFLEPNSAIPRGFLQVTRWGNIRQYRELLVDQLELKPSIDASYFNLETHITPGFLTRNFDPGNKNRAAGARPNAPSWELQDLSGNSLSMKGLKGKIVLLDFWYKNCLPCQQAMPKLQEIQDRFRDQGVVVVGLNAKDTDPADIRRFLAERRISYPVCMGADPVTYKYNVQGYPTLFIIDREGRIASTKVGFKQSQPGDVIAIIEELLAKG